MLHRCCAKIRCEHRETAAPVSRAKPPDPRHTDPAPEPVPPVHSRRRATCVRTTQWHQAGVFPCCEPPAPAGQRPKPLVWRWSERDGFRSPSQPVHRRTGYGRIGPCRSVRQPPAMFHAQAAKNPAPVPPAHWQAKIAPDRPAPSPPAPERQKPASHPAKETLF